jgi:hypothetical protein
MSDLDDIKLQEQVALSLRVRTLCQIYGESAENVGTNVGTGEFSHDEDLSVVRQFETDQAFREERLWLIRG